MRAKEKNMKIWNIIGPSVCNYYKSEEQIDIKFIKADMDDRKMAQ
jgi:hypothetical protein